MLLAAGRRRSSPPLSHLRSLFANGLLALLVIALGVAQPSAAPFTLKVTQVTNAIATLQLSGETGTNYQIEGSTNLNAWFPVGSGVAVTGALIRHHTNSEGYRAIFYRGTTATTALPYPTIHVERDSVFSVNAVLAAGAAKDIRVALPNGTAFTLHVPTNAVFSDTMVTLSVLTQAVGIPAANGFRAGVVLEPEGLTLAAPALLEIEFPTPFPQRQMASYTFDNNGKHLHLVPDLVGTQNVRIFVNRLAGYGTGVFTLAELNGIAATVPIASAPSRRATLHATLEECYPDEKAEADALQKDLEAKLAPVQQRIAAILGRARQEQPLGVEDLGSPTLVQAFSEGQKFYDTQIQPRIATASKKYQVAAQLAPWVLGWDRQRQLLGISDESNSLDLGSYICPIFKRCDEQILECCRTRGGDRRLLLALLGNERQRQLLDATGGECGSFDFEQAEKECAPKWIARLTIHDVGTYSTNRENANFRSHKDESYEYIADLIIDTVEESITPPILFLPGSTNLVVRLAGKAQGHHLLNARYDDLHDACSAALAAQGGARKAANLAPTDGGYELHSVDFVHSSLETNLVVTINASLPGPGGEAFGMTQSIAFQVPPVQVAQQGLNQTTSREVTSTGCLQEQSIETPDGLDLYGGNVFNLQPGTFHYEPGLVQFYWEERTKNDDMPLLRTVTLEMRKLK